MKSSKLFEYGLTFESSTIVVFWYCRTKFASELFYEWIWFRTHIHRVAHNNHCLYFRTSAWWDPKIQWWKKLRRWIWNSADTRANTKWIQSGSLVVCLCQRGKKADESKVQMWAFSQQGLHTSNHTTAGNGNSSVRKHWHTWKKALINAHVLKYSDPSKQPIIQTDVPKDRDACLLQKAQSVTHAALTDTEKDNDVFWTKRVGVSYHLLDNSLKGDWNFTQLLWTSLWFHCIPLTVLPGSESVLCQSGCRISDSHSNAKHYLSLLEVKEPTLQLCQYESQSKLER